MGFLDLFRKKSEIQVYNPEQKENLPEIVTNYIMGLECPNPLRALENFMNAAKEAVK